MGFLDRLKGLLGGSEAAAPEDPQRVVARILTELRQHLADGRARVTAAIRDEKRLEAELVRVSGELGRAVAAAKERLAAGDEAGARRHLARKIQAQALQNELELELVRHREVVGHLKEGLARLADQLRTMEARRTQLRAKVRRTRALEARARAIEASDGAVADALVKDAFDRLDVEEELLKLGSSGDALERRFLELEQSGEHQVKQLEDLRKKLEEA